MTQSVTNSLNNINEMLMQAKSTLQEAKSVAEPVTEKFTDNKTDFSKVFDKHFSKDTIDTGNKEVKTLGDVKKVVINDNLPENWANFKEVLSQATGEANVETSLDLTLAKDINEIISRLKETLDEKIDTTESTVEESVVVEDLMSEEVVEEIEVAEEDNKEIDQSQVSVMFEQVLAYINKVDDTKFGEEVKSFVEDTNAKETEIIDMNPSDLESLDLLTKLPAEEKIDIQAETELNLEEELLKELNIESVNAETASSDENSLMDRQTPEEQAVKAMLNQDIEAFDVKIDKVLNASNVQQVQPKQIDVNPSKILDQITKQLEGLQNNSKVNIVLNPESLGRVTVQLIKTGEGLSAQFTVASQEVKDMLMKGLDSLKETLMTQGVGVENVSVKVNDAQKSEYNADWTEQEGSRGGNKGQRQQDKEEKEKGLFEKMMAQTFEENGNV